MLDSVNLPLDRKKIIKKTLALSLLPLLVFVLSIILIGIGIAFSSDFGLLGWVGGALLIISALILGGFYLYQVYYYKLYFYKFEDGGAEISKGVISRSTGHVQYHRIQDISVDQDFLDRIFGLYDVHYETAGEVSGMYSHVDGLNKQNADTLVAFLKTRLGRHPEQGHVPAAVQSAEGPRTTTAEDEKVVFNRDNTPLSKKFLASQIIARLGTVIGVGLYVGLRNYFDEGPIDIWFAGFLGIVGGGFIIALIVYTFLWFKNFQFEFSGVSGTLRQGVVAKSETHIYYDRVQNINAMQTVMDRLLGIHTVSIETAGGSGKMSTFTISGLSKTDAEKIKDFLQGKLAVNRNRV